MRNKPALPTGTILREFQFPTDYPQVISLWNNAGPGIHVRRSDEEGEIAKKLQRDPDLFLVVEAGGRIIASVIGGYDGRRGMVYHLAVDEDFRKLGIASVLMTELENRLKQKGCRRSYLMVAHDNQDAIHFYESHGWEQMDILTFGKDLD
jgi:ribosomal protein S18 acetylase RimI-like enzyme